MRKPIEFGNFIHDLRKEKKDSLKIVADKLGVDISLLSKIENGDRQLQRRMLRTFLLFSKSIIKNYILIIYYFVLKMSLDKNHS